jgi:ketosteroid isomerase-like protein
VPTNSPRAVVEELIRGISEGDWPALHAFFAADAVIDYPFALPAPTRLDGGDAIRRYFAGIAASGLELRAHDVVVHETGDPEVVVAEWDYDGRVASSGRTFCVSNVTVSRVRDGRIVASRDYHNHAVLAVAMGRLPSLLGALTGDGVDPAT